MTSSRALALAALLAGPSQALAGACCVGSTSTLPTQLGECEQRGVGVIVGGEVSRWRWDASRATHSSSLVTDSLTTTVAGGFRTSRRFQVLGAVPVRANRYALADLTETGWGVGDVSVGVVWDPTEEIPRVEGLEKRPLPVPILRLGARLPTGRDWRHAETSLHADVTGLDATSLTAGLGFERTLDRTPWSVGLDGDVGVGASGVLGSLAASGGVGHYFGQRLSLLASAQHVWTFTSSDQGSGTTERTGGGLQLVLGKPRAWRAWGSLGADLPVPGLGKSAAGSVRAGLGFLQIL